jgi:hypothetical protein
MSSSHKKTDEVCPEYLAHVEEWQKKTKEAETSDNSPPTPTPSKEKVSFEPLKNVFLPSLL